MRENFARALAAAERRGAAPRVMFKFGGSHMMRDGTTRTRWTSARPQRSWPRGGASAFNLLVLAGPGAKSTRMNILSGQYEPTGEAEIGDTNTSWLIPALPDEGWSV
ncbi:MAG: hypothetical protein U0163_05285 [Gemmatimonadaceae bacterium]